MEECAVGSQKEGGKAVSMVTLNLNKTSHTDRCSLERHRSVLPAEPETADCQASNPPALGEPSFFMAPAMAPVALEQLPVPQLSPGSPSQHPGDQGPVVPLGHILKSRVELPSSSHGPSPWRLCQTHTKQQDRSLPRPGHRGADG